MKNIELPSTRKVISRVCYVIAVVFLVIVACNFKSTMSGKQETTSFGYKPIIVVTGSMEPVIKVNSLSILKYCTIDDLNVGDIVMYKYGTLKIAHRVIEKNEDSVGKYLITKGDANEFQDNIDITPDMVVGKLVTTYNGVAKFISCFMIAPGEIDSTAISQLILFLMVFIYLFGLLIFEIFNFIVAVNIAFFKKKTIESSLDDYEYVLERNRELQENVEQLLSDKADDTVVAALMKAKLMKEIKSLRLSTRDFEKELKFISKVKKCINIYKKK